MQSCPPMTGCIRSLARSNAAYDAHFALRARDDCRSPTTARSRNSSLPGGHAGMNAPIPQNSDRIDMARTPLRRAMAARNRRLARCAGARDRRRHHPRRQRHRRGRAPGRRRGARRAAGLGRHALRPARRDPAQGRRADGGEPDRARLLDHARDRRHRGQGGVRSADGDQHPAPLGRDAVRSRRGWCCRATAAGYRSPGACRAA